MIKQFNLRKPNFLIGLLFTSLFMLTGCKEGSDDKKTPENSDTLDLKLSYLAPADSVDFVYSSPSWKRTSLENRFGQNLYLIGGTDFVYESIDSDNEFHTYNSKTNEHTYSVPICKGEISAYKIDSSFMYLLYRGMFYKKDHQLHTIDSFAFKPPVINKKHGIDFDIESTASLFKIKKYYVLMYYVIDPGADGTSIYKSSDHLFYYFNRDTAFFANKQCGELDSSFQYFRYPAVANDGEYLYHAPRVMNCISKSSENKTLIHTPIDKLKNNYLTLGPNEQYEISKLKKHRFSTNYNRNILLSDDRVYLIKEMPAKISYKDNIRTYETVLELKQFDKQLNLIKTVYIKDHIYSYALANGNKILLFNFYKNKYFIYEM